jgi:hypothetical protein
MATWANPDGLTIYYGTDAAEVGTDGEYKTFDNFRVLEYRLNLTELTEAETVQSRVIFPKGKVLAKVEVITEQVAATGVAIDVGLVGRETSPTVNDPDGVLAAFPLASMSSLGETTTFWEDTSVPLASAAFGGALIGTVVSAENDVPLNLTASRTTATAFTTGIVLVRLYWYNSPVR